jgi:hypothetical protein
MAARSARWILLFYAGAVAAIFLWAYAVAQVREMGLYLLILWLNLPASLVVVPVSEQLASAAGLALGGPAHVWATQVASLAANGALISLAIWLPHMLVVRLRRGHKPGPSSRT